MTVGIIVAIVAAILIIALAAAWYRRRGAGADAELRQLDMRSLTPSEHEYYLEDWVHIQGSFVDSPGVALESADTLVGQLLTDVGYPTDDESRLLRLLSVRHAPGVPAYREARAVHAKRKDGATDIDTESLRVALNGYDTLFQDLVSAHAASSDPATRQHEAEAAS